MLIAHGNVSQLILEQTGILKNFNFSRVKHTQRTLGGGVFAKQWIATFVQALKMSTNLNTSSTGSQHKSSVESYSEKEKDSSVSKTQLTYELPLSAIRLCTIADSICELKQVTGCNNPLGLVLDLKSRHVPKRVWAFLIDTMRRYGIRVEAVATFYIEDICDISNFCLHPVNEVIFFHTAGDLQHACLSGLFKQDDDNAKISMVYFNAGSLFWNYKIVFLENIAAGMKDFNVNEVKKKYRFEPYACSDQENGGKDLRCSTIKQYKDHYNLSIGLYLQEFCVDDEILNLLIEYVNRNEHIYDLGISWGGVNGLTVNGIQPGRFTQTDGRFKL